jgi:hypothetical protein
VTQPILVIPEQRTLIPIYRWQARRTLTHSPDSIYDERGYPLRSTTYYILWSRSL